MLGSIESATLVPGTDLLAVADGITQEISWFTRAGAYVRTLGGKGGGPGESRALRQIRGTAGGGLCSWDVDRERVTRQDTVRFVLFTRDGALEDTIATVPGPRNWFANRANGFGGDTFGAERLIFGDQLMSFVSGGRLWVGIDDSLRWTRFDLRTGVVDAVRLRARVRHASAGQIAAQRKRRLEDALAEAPRMRGRVILNGVDGADLERKWATEVMPSLPASSSVPAYDRVVPGDDGSIWLREFPMPADTAARWVLLTSAHRLDGHLRLPRSSVVMAGDSDWLLVRTKDSMDVPTLRVLHREGGDGE